MSGLLAPILVAFVSAFVPGVLIAYALLHKTELHHFEIITIGFTFGLMGPPIMTWLESFLRNYIHFFSFSLQLAELNVVVLTIIGIVLCLQQGLVQAFLAWLSGKEPSAKPDMASEAEDQAEAHHNIHEIRERLQADGRTAPLLAKHLQEERELLDGQRKEMALLSGLNADERSRIDAANKMAYDRLVSIHADEERRLLRDLDVAKPARAARQGHAQPWVWLVLLVLMLATFATRMQSINTAPTFFEFDPYFDMMSAQQILVLGYQPYTTTAAWPVVPAGTVTRVQPLIPYLEAYWYSLANGFSSTAGSFSTTLMSYVGGFYPPITAALLVFVIFVLLYHEYDAYIGLIGASLTATMPILISTFIAGEQLLEPWGIFSLFFFVAAYMLAVRNMKSKRLAILAGIAFASTFLGAHYYTADTGILAVYIVLQGLIDVIRNGSVRREFYKMNVIVLVVTAIFYAPYYLYRSTLSGSVPTILGIPITLSFPIIALILVIVVEFIMRFAEAKIKAVSPFKQFSGQISRLVIVVAISVVLALIVFLTPIGKPFQGYINLSAHFTTPSTPLFMTVAEFEPSGFAYDFAGAGLGFLAANMFGLPVILWVVASIALILILISIIYRDSKTGIFYAAVAIPLLFAGFSEVKYLPHLGLVYIMLFCIMLGELIFMSKVKFRLTKEAIAGQSDRSITHGAYSSGEPMYAYAILSIGLFFVSAILALVLLLALIMLKFRKNNMVLWTVFVVLIMLFLANVLIFGSSPFFGESSSFVQLAGAASVASSNPANLCAILGNQNNQLGSGVYCNTIQSYWIPAAAWMRQNVGPGAPRILAWWDYGDWINWFGNSNAVLRGDNSQPPEDYAAAANFVLGSNDNFTPQSLANMMKGNQTKYVLLDGGLISKWQALDFLACVHVNQTSEQFARAEGQSQNPPQPFALGNSPCELTHDPTDVLLPYSAVLKLYGGVPNASISLNMFCSISTNTTIYITGLLSAGSNSTLCVNATPNAEGVLKIYNQSGVPTDMVMNINTFQGVQNLCPATSTPCYYALFPLIYLPTTYSFELNVTDSASTPEVATSPSSSSMQSQFVAPPRPAASRPRLDANQSETITGSMPASGTPPYSYRWMVSANNGTYTNATQCSVGSGSDQATSSMVTCYIKPGALAPKSTYSFELHVVESTNATNNATSPASQQIAVAGPLATPQAPSVSSSQIDQLQGVNVTGMVPSGGTPPYSYQWLVSVSGVDDGAYLPATQCQTDSGVATAAANAVTCAIKAGTLSAAHNYSFELMVSDNATTPESEISAPSHGITVSQSATPGKPVVSDGKLDADQGLLVTGALPNGTATYSYDWLVSTDNGTYTSATQCAADSGTNRSASSMVECVIPPNTLAPNSTYRFKLYARSAATAYNSSPSDAVTVAPRLGTPSISVSAPKLDSNQQETITGTIPTGGTPPLSYTWLVSENGGAYTASSVCNAQIVTNPTAGKGVTCGIPAGMLIPGDNYTFKMLVHDSASTTEASQSAASETVNVSSPLVLATAPSVVQGQGFGSNASVITGTMPDSGTPPYSYMWLISKNGGPYVPATQCKASSGSGQAALSTVTCSVQPNTLAAAGSIANASSQFYYSNFYKGFILGNLPGFTEVYPQNATGINYVNGTWPIRIYAVDNYTSGNVPAPAKPPWVHNNYTMP